MFEITKSITKTIILAVLLLGPVFTCIVRGNLPPNPPPGKENPVTVRTPIYDEVLVDTINVPSWEIVDTKKVPLKDDCGCPTGKFEYIPIYDWVEVPTPVYETQIVGYDVSVECIELKVPFGRPVYQPLVRKPYFFLRNEYPSENIFSPGGIFFCSSFASFIQTIKVEANGDTFLKIIMWDGNPTEFTIVSGQSSGAPSGDYEGNPSRIKMLADDGTTLVTSSPYYYEVDFGNGVTSLYTASDKKLCSTTTAEGVVLAPDDKDIGQEIIRDDADSLRQIHSAADGLADIVVPEGYEGVKYEIRLYAHGEFGAKDGNGLYTINQDGTPHTVWTIEKTSTPPAINKVRFTKTRGETSTTYDWEYSDGLKKWTLDSAGLKTMSKSNLYNEAKTELLTTVQRKNADDTLVIQEYENLHKYAFGYRAYKKTVGATGEGEPKLETNITYHENSAETGKYGQEKSIVRSSGKWERYDYDSTGRKIEIEKSFKNAASTATSGIVVITKSYTAVDENDTPLSNDTRPRTIEEKVDGVTVKKVYFAYYTNGSNEDVEITEAASTPAAAYGAAANAKRTEVSYASTATAPAAGKTKYVIYPDGKKDTFTYEFGTISNPGDPDEVTFTPDVAGGCVRVTTLHGTTTNDNGVAYKSTKETGIVNERGDIVLKETYVYDGSAYSRILWEYRVYDSEHHATSTYTSNNTQEDTTWNCCSMESETHADGTEHTYTYDALSRVLTKTKKGVSGSTPDIVTTYTYDAANRMLSESVADGTNTLTTSKAYDICGRLTSETDASGLTTSITYTNPTSTVGIIVTRTFPDSSTKITEKYFDGRIKSITGTAIVAKHYDYGVESQTGYQWTKVSISSAASTRYTKTYKNVLGKVAKIEQSGYDEATITTEFYYNNSGQLYKKTQTGLADTLYEYDSLGNQIRSGLDISDNGTLDLASADRVSDSDTVFTLISSDWWQVTTNKTYATTDSSTSTTTSISKTRVTGLASGTVSEVKTTDIHGNETVATTTVNRTTKTVTQTVDLPNSSIDGQTIKVNGLVTSNRNQSNLTITIAYDGLGRRTGVTDPRIGQATTAYYTTGTGKIGKVYTQTDAASKVTTYDYNTTTGRLAWVQNALSKKTYFDYNDRGQVTNTWGDVGYPIEKGYDTYGQNTTLKTYRAGTNWTGSTWPTATTGTADTITWAYDASSGLVTSKTFADSNAVTYTYTSVGKLYVRTWDRTSGGNPLTTTYSYDANTGEQTGINYSDSTQDITFSYKRSGQKYQVSDSVGTRTFAYNSALQESTETIAAGLYGKVLTRSYSSSGYLGRYTGVNISTEYVKTLGYDTYGRMNTVSDGTDTFTYAYLASSDLVSGVTRPNNLTTDYSYEANRNLMTTVANKYNTTTTISSYVYRYDNVGKRNDVVNTGTAFTTSNLINWTYNDRSELLTAKKYNSTNPDSPTNAVTAYDYALAFDNIGNRSSYNTSTGGTATTYTLNNVNQYTATANPTQSLTYDADGDMLTDGAGWNNTWNGENRLIETYNDTVGNKLEFDYDYMGRRVEKKVYTGTSGTSWTLSTHEKFVYDGYKCIEVLDGANSNAILQKFLWSNVDFDVPLSVYDTAATATYYYFADANKNIGQLMDSSGNTVAKYEYSPFGVQTSSTGTYAATNPFCFSSEYYDSETTLVYYNYRYYSSVLGRWLSRDPIEEEGGWNLYGMVNNNPVGNWDNLGQGALGKILKGTGKGAAKGASKTDSKAIQAADERIQAAKLALARCRGKARCRCKPKCRIVGSYSSTLKTTCPLVCLAEEQSVKNATTAYNQLLVAEGYGLAGTVAKGAAGTAGTAITAWEIIMSWF